MDENKKRALAAALGQIERQFGKGSVMRMGDRTVEAVETIGTGSLMLDIALGIGGLPKGRVAVSYTHLDVYKRQFVHQRRCSCWHAESKQWA